MAGEGRAKIGFTDVLTNFKPDDYGTTDAPAKPRPSRAEIRETAEDSGFRSREPVKAEKPAASIVPNRRRTGRTDQIGIRTTTETKEKFKYLADANGWSEAVAFEKAVELLSNQYKSQR
jgi:hypothetical protein